MLTLLWGWEENHTQGQRMGLKLTIFNLLSSTSSTPLAKSLKVHAQKQLLMKQYLANTWE